MLLDSLSLDKQIVSINDYLLRNFNFVFFIKHLFSSKILAEINPNLLKCPLNFDASSLAVKLLTVFV